MSNKALWDLIESKLIAYPRYDDEPVLGLDTDRYIIITLVHDPKPTYDPDNEYLMPTSTIDLDALTYTYGWLIEQLPPPSPDYNKFYAELLISDVYQEVLNKVLTTSSPAPAGALAIFVSAMQDCLAGRANPPAMQQSIWLLLSQLNLDNQWIEKLQQMLNDSHLSSIYTLSLPES